MKKTLYCISGLPRSGSTLLCNILAQNPKFHATHTSACLEILFNIRNCWDQFIEHKAHPLNAERIECLRAVLDAYHFRVKKPVIFEKSRGWLAHLELLEHLLDQRPKVLVPVRDLRDVVASFEKLWRAAKRAGRQLAVEAANYLAFQRIEDRVAIWLTGQQPIGLAVNRVRDACLRGYRDCLHFVDYTDLTTTPETTMAQIYEFLGEPAFEHSFDCVEQVTIENDDVHGFGVPLHDIRPKVAPQAPQYPQVLGAAAETIPLQDAFFWHHL